MARLNRSKLRAASNRMKALASSIRRQRIALQIAGIYTEDGLWEAVLADHASMAQKVPYVRWRHIETGHIREVTGEEAEQYFAHMFPDRKSFGDN